jgi:RNase P subunit RPR2
MRTVLSLDQQEEVPSMRTSDRALWTRTGEIRIMKCFICEKENRPLIQAKCRFTKDRLKYDMVVWACLKCLGIKEERLE